MAVVSDLNILLLEDNALDAELIILKLRAGGVAFRPTHVQTRQEFVDALHGREFDLILSDFSLPGFDGLRLRLHSGVPRKSPSCSSRGRWARTWRSTP